MSAEIPPEVNGRHNVTIKLEMIRQHHANAAVLVSTAAQMFQQGYAALTAAAHETAAALEMADLSLTTADMDAAAERLKAAAKMRREAQRKGPQGPRIIRPGE